MLTACEWSTDQEAALYAAREWLDERSRPYLTLGGLAGCGKTTVVAELARTWGNVAVCALAGKAANVLREKGIPATTIHSLIYTPVRAGGKTSFKLRTQLERFVRVIIVDEASMVDTVLLADLLSFKIPILFVGDHGQLEPIGRNPGLMKKPDIRLEKIHRQEDGDPIVEIATAFRNDAARPRWQDFGNGTVVTARKHFDEYVTPEAQMICGYNATRHRVNRIVRAMIGHTGLVQPGDKLICMRNNRPLGLFNGQQVAVEELGHETKHLVDLVIKTDAGRSVALSALKTQFGGDLDKDHRLTRNPGVVLLDYGHCVTCHKAQGSEWDSVVVLEEIAKSWDARRWRYTAATRAKKQLVYCC